MNENKLIDLITPISFIEFVQYKKENLHLTTHLSVHSATRWTLSVQSWRKNYFPHNWA